MQIQSIQLLNTGFEAITSGIVASGKNLGLSEDELHKQ